MNQRVVKLKAAVQKDKERIQKLQEKVKTNEEKIKELQNTEIMNNLNSLSSKGVSVNEIVEAIKEKDIDVLIELMSEKDKDKSGSTSAFEILKEEQ